MFLLCLGCIFGIVQSFFSQYIFVLVLRAMLCLKSIIQPNYHPTVLSNWNQQPSIGKPAVNENREGKLSFKGLKVFQGLDFFLAFYQNENIKEHNKEIKYG